MSVQEDDILNSMFRESDTTSSNILNGIIQNKEARISPTSISSSVSTQPHFLKSAIKQRYKKNCKSGSIINQRRRILRRQDSNYRNDYNYIWSDNTVIASSPMLNSTPPIVSRRLLKLYPYLIILDRFLDILAWNNKEFYWVNYSLVIIFFLFVRYFELVMKYMGHILLFLLLLMYSLLDKYVNSIISTYPTLDDIILIMGTLSQKADLVQAPITILNKQDITRLWFTIMFFTPCYIILTTFIISPRYIFLIVGLYLLTYHSPFCRWTRKFLWNFKLIRLALFYLTGLDFGGLTNKDKNAFRKAIETVAMVSNNNNGDTETNDKTGLGGVRYTFVLFENQRKWIGVGWTASMLSYERDCWTDEHLNPTSDLANFKLPQDDSDENQWRWVDNYWYLDRTNNGAIQLSSKESTLTLNPADDEGFIYYDNTWKNPSLEDTFTKYTRRRRWVRTAEFISNKYLEANDNQEGIVSSTKANVDSAISSSSISTLSITHEKATNNEKFTIKSRKVSFSENNNVHILPLNGYMNENDVYEG